MLKSKVSRITDEAVRETFSIRQCQSPVAYPRKGNQPSGVSPWSPSSSSPVLPVSAPPVAVMPLANFSTSVQSTSASTIERVVICFHATFHFRQKTHTYTINLCGIYLIRCSNPFLVRGSGNRMFPLLPTSPYVP